MYCLLYVSVYAGYWCWILSTHSSLYIIHLNDTTWLNDDLDFTEQSREDLPLYFSDQSQTSLRFFWLESKETLPRKSKTCFQRNHTISLTCIETTLHRILMNFFQTYHWISLIYVMKTLTRISVTFIQTNVTISLAFV